MYEKKIPLDLECGIKITMEVIGGKWKSCILEALDKRPMRPSELHRNFTDASSRVIDQQLKELEFHGMIKKIIFAELPPHSEYSITEKGKTLLPVIAVLREWGESFKEEMKELLHI
ncbi:MAG: helix-turn-helix transcriptional regulator [Bacteroidales bacterium]|nr:helix-turn-helix transcriptional regulator [Bacteroidales bacterium]